MPAVVVAVQQLEGNALQPIVQGRGLDLRAAVVILDGRSPEVGPDGVAARLVPGGHGLTVVHERRE